jgi:hypothetical protein
MTPRIGVRRHVNRKIQGDLLLGKNHDVGILRLHPVFQGVDCVLNFARYVACIVLGTDILRLHVHGQFYIRAVPEIDGGLHLVAGISGHFKMSGPYRHRQRSGRSEVRQKSKTAPKKAGQRQVFVWQFPYHRM